MQTLMAFLILANEISGAAATPALMNFTSGHLSVKSTVGHLSVFHCHVPHPDAATPLIVWMNGGPGASSLMGFFTELGPYLFNLQSEPKAATEAWRPFANPYSWSKLGSLLVWEQPAGVGFSRCVEGCPRVWNDTTSATANLAILRAFYAANPSSSSRDLIISGESYGGIYVPLLATRVLLDASMSAAGVHLRGVAIGDGCTAVRTQTPVFAARL